HIEAGEPRHLDVEEYQVRPLPLQGAHGFSAIAALCDDLELRRLVQPQRNAASRQQLVVDDRRADPHALTLCGTCIGRGKRGSAVRGATSSCVAISSGSAMSTRTP